MFVCKLCAGNRNLHTDAILERRNNSCCGARYEAPQKEWPLSGPNPGDLSRNVLGLPFQSIYIRFQKTVAFFSYRHSSAISNGLHNHRYIKDLYIKHKGILKISDLPFVSFRTMRFPSFASCDYGIRMRRRDDPVSHGLYARNHIMRLQTYIKKQQWTSRRIEKIFIRISATY